MSDWVRYLENKKLWTCTPRSIPPSLRVSILLSLFSCFFSPSFSLLPPSVTSVCTHAGKRAYAARGNNGGFHGIISLSSTIHSKYSVHTRRGWPSTADLRESSFQVEKEARELWSFVQDGIHFNSICLECGEIMGT